MNDGEAFIRAIVDSPGDETPRLVYADWLEERGDPRGAYLRAEHEWARSRKSKALKKVHILAIPLDAVWLARVSRPPVGVCSEQVQVRGRGPTVDAESIDQLEQRFGITLPDDYRAFMLNYDGCVIDYSGGLIDYNFWTPDGEQISTSRRKHMFFSLGCRTRHGDQPDLESLALHINQHSPAGSSPHLPAHPPHGCYFQVITVGLNCFGQLGLGVGGAVGSPTVIPAEPFHQLGLFAAVAGEVLSQHAICQATDITGYVMRLLPGSVTAKTLATSFAEFLSNLSNPDCY
jgi:uncharacterized protein (TIGR02996 family)